MRKIVFLLFLYSDLAFGQKEDLVWVFGNNCLMDFNYSPVKAESTQKPFVGFEGSASVSDKNGKLLLYTNGQTVYDYRGLPLPNGSGLAGAYSAATTLMAKAPGCNTLYYIFTTGSHEENNVLSYTLIDLSLNSGFGDVVANKKNVPLTNEYTSEKLDLTFHNNGTDYWLLAHSAVGNSFYSFQISTAGILPPVISNIGFNFPTPFQAAGGMKISGNGKYIGITYHEYAPMFSGNNVQILNYNTATGQVGSIKFETRLPEFSVAFDIAFSPNERFVYVTTFHAYLAGHASCYQYDLNEINPNLSVYRMNHTQDISTGIELGPDGRIYIAHVDKNYNAINALSIIANPNEKGILCNFLPDGISLPIGTGSLTNLSFSIKARACPANTCDIILKQTCLSNGSVELLILDANGDKVNPLIRKHELFWSLNELSAQGNYSITQRNPVIVPGGTVFSVTSKIYSWVKGVPKTIEFADICQRRIMDTAQIPCSGICNDFDFILSSCGDQYSVNSNLKFPPNLCHSICRNDCKFIIALFEKDGSIVDPNKYVINWSTGGKNSYVELMQPYYNNLSVQVTNGDCIWQGRYVRDCSGLNKFIFINSNRSHSSDTEVSDAGRVIKCDEENNFSIVNGTDGSIFLYSSRPIPEESIEVSVYTISGMKISSFHTKADKTYLDLNSNLFANSNVYIIHVSQKNRNQWLKFIRT